MSQFPDSTFEQQPAYGTQQPLRTSGLAITALIFGILAVIPCIGICGAPVGLLLGLIGVATIGPEKGTKGKGMAAVAIVLSLVGIGVQYFTIQQTYVKYFRPMLELTMEGPDNALTAGFGGDLAGFKDSFHGAGATAPDAQAQAFLDALEDRYGAFQGSRLDDSQQAARPGIGQTSMVAPYILTFSNATVDADAELVFADQDTGQWVMKLGSITVKDPDQGDLDYPPSSSGAISPPGGTGGDADDDTDTGGDADSGGGGDGGT